ncbi:MAG TPA: hypothetical protein VHV29_20585 [Terriglobales bacterium]|jgi:hypothetical protein|nr:hypothetical protein [Terriglobales bacterium]
MSRKSKAAGVVIVLLAGAAGAVWAFHFARTRTTTLRGAVITANVDPRKQLPVGGVEITASDGISVVRTTSDSSGMFAIALRKRIFRNHLVTLRFRHMDYAPLNMHVLASGKIYIADMVPIQPEKPIERSLATQTISSNVVVRYSIKTAAVMNVASAAKPFEVENKGDQPCSERPPCSPDGKWKASVGSVTLDAGVGNQFRNVRASCIAGPCPFTRIDPPELSQDGRMMTIRAMVWSDTSTFLVEAEIVHPTISDLVRNSYPVIFGDALNFTLPPAAEGVSLQAELNGESIVFPLGPDLVLSWADCSLRSNPDQTRVYRCTLKPEYRWTHAKT